MTPDTKQQVLPQLPTTPTQLPPFGDTTSGAKKPKVRPVVPTNTTGMSPSVANSGYKTLIGT